MKRLVILVVVMSLFPGLVLAGQNIPPEKKFALQQLVEDEFMCANIHQAVHNCIDGEDDRSKDIRGWTSKVRDAEIKSALILGKTIGMTDEALNALSKLITQQVLAKLNNDCVNLPAVISQDKMDIQKCKMVMESPDQRLKEIVAENAKIYKEGSSASGQGRTK